MKNAETLSAIISQAAKQATSRLELWEILINALKPKTMLELGVWKGGFAAHILERCQSIETYYMLDPWRSLQEWNKPLNKDAAVFDDAYDAAIKATKFAGDRVVVLRGTTAEVIHQIADESLDLAYVDGDHTLRGITLDLLNVFPKLRSGGYLAGDDFSASIWQHATKYEPTLVFPFALYFSEAHQMPIYAMPYGQFIMHKSAETSGYKFTDFVGAYSAHDLLHHVKLGTLIRRKARKLLTGY
jgi:predicted O-methyltransferase YrrM